MHAKVGSSSSSSSSSESCSSSHSPASPPLGSDVGSVALGSLASASWNTNGLLVGYRLGGPSMHLFRRRVARIARRMEHYEVVFLQEACATAAEVQLLRAHFPGAELHGTCVSGIGAGGIVTMISRAFGDQYPGWEFTVVVPGCIAILRCRHHNGARLGLANARMTPYGAVGSPVTQLRRLRRAVRSRREAATVLAGDVNFVDSAEDRPNLLTGRQANLRSCLPSSRRSSRRATLESSIAQRVGRGTLLCLRGSIGAGSRCRPPSLPACLRRRLFWTSG